MPPLVSYDETTLLFHLVVPRLYHSLYNFRSSLYLKHSPLYCGGVSYRAPVSVVCGISLFELGTFVRMPTMFRSHVNRPPYPSSRSSSSRSSSSSKSSNFIMKIVSSNSIKNRSGSFSNSFMSSLDNVTMYSFSDSQINL